MCPLVQQIFVGKILGVTAMRLSGGESCAFLTRTQSLRVYSRLVLLSSWPGYQWRISLSRLQEGWQAGEDALHCPRFGRQRGKPRPGLERRSKGCETVQEMAFDRTWKSIINMEGQGGRSLGPSWHSRWMVCTSKDREGQEQECERQLV